MKPLERQPEHQQSAFADLLAVFREKIEHRWLFAALSVAIPGGLLLAFMIQYDREADYRPPDVVFFKDWNAGRTDAQVRAQQAIDGPIERAQRAELARLEAEKRAKYRKVAEDMGIDVDK